MGDMSEQCRTALSLALADQDRRWRAGSPLTVEAYLEKEPTLRANPDAVLDLIYKEVMARSEAGETPALDEYTRRFPDLADALRPIFEVHHALESGDAELTSLDAPADATLPAPPSDAQTSWPTVPGYEILERLGHGGMGVVYKARQVSLGRIVALKMILAGPHARPEDLARFRREAEVVARLAHPNIVQIHEVGEHDGRPFLSLEFIAGGGLDRKLAGAPLPGRDAAQLVETLARAIQHAHTQGVIHRDLKPANILVQESGVRSQGSGVGNQGSPSGNSDSCLLTSDSWSLKITDFGLARLDAGSGQTQSGDILGTPGYMAPEQAAGRNSDIGPGTDIYALGATLYELLTGRPPFRADNALETLRQVLDQEPVSPSQLQPGAPRDLVTVCLKCLQKRPSKRYASADELAADLRRFLDGRPIQARQTPAWERAVKWARRRPALAGLYVLAVAATVVLGIYTVWLHDALGEAEKQRINAQKAQTKAEVAAEERRVQLVRARLADGARLLDEGDWFGALLPFADALKLDHKDEKRAEIHRVRLATILRQCPRLVQFWPHDNDVSVAEFTADGRRVLTASGNTANLLDADTGKPVVEPMVHGASITSAALSPDGRRVATAADDHTVQIWDVAKNQRVGEPLRLKDTVVRVVFAANGDRVVTATRRAPLKVRSAGIIDGGIGVLAAAARSETFEVRIESFDVATGKPASPPLTIPTSPLSDVDISPDGRLAATADYTPTKTGQRVLNVWDVATGKRLLDVRYVPTAMTLIRFSPDGGRVAAFCVDGMVRVWDCRNTTQTAEVRHGAPVLHLAFSPDGRRIATAGIDGVVHVWEAVSGKQLVTLRHGPMFTHAVAHVAFSPDGLYAVTAGADNTARVWDATTGTTIAPPLWHGDKVIRASFGRDGRFVLTAGADRTVRIWDLASGRLATPPLEHEDAVTHASFDSGGKKAVTAGADKVARVWDLASGHGQGPPLLHAHKLVYAAFRTDSGVVTSGESNSAGVGEASGWDAAKGTLQFRRATGQQIGGVPLTDPTIRRAWFSPDGRSLVGAERAGAVRVWNVETGKPVTGELDTGSAVTGVSFSADGRHMVTETFLPEFTVRAFSASGATPATLGKLIQIMRPANTVTVWEVDGGKKIASIGPWSDAASLSFRRADFTPDGRSLLLVCDKEARLWDIAEARIVRRFRKPGAAVASAALSPDGSALATACDDETVQLWNAGSGELVPGAVPFRHGGQSWPPRFSADGRFLVLSCRPAGVRIWDAATGDPVSPPLGHPGLVESVAFSSDGKRLLTASDRAARVWSVSADDRGVDNWLRLAELLSCSRMHAQGRPVPLLPEELRAAWDKLRRASGSAFEARPQDAITWHAEAVRACEKLGRWDAALPHLERLAVLDPERVDLYARRGRAYAEAGQWQPAATDFARAVSDAPHKAQHWHRHALVRLHLDERDTYRRVSTDMLDRFEASDDLDACQLAAWTGALGPIADEAHGARLLKAAERAVKENPKSHPRLLTLGAAQYRAGRYKDAVRTLDQAVKIWGKDETVWDWLFLTLAHHQLGQHDLAEANFNRAARWIDQRQTTGPNGTLVSTLFWSDRLELSQLRREAESLRSKVPRK